MKRGRKLSVAAVEAVGAAEAAVVTEAGAAAMEAAVVAAVVVATAAEAVVDAVAAEIVEIAETAGNRAFRLKSDVSSPGTALETFLKTSSR
jgi:hypothetical protein